VLRAIAASALVIAGCTPCARSGQTQISDGSINALAADATALYFATDDAIWRLGLGSTQPTRLASASYPLEITVDGDHVIWAESRGDDAIMSVPTEGGAAAVIATSLNTPHGLAADGQTVYWSDGSGNVISTAPETGGAGGEVAVVPPSDPGRSYIEPVAIAVDATTLYWMDWSFVTILAMAKTGGPATTPIQGPYGLPPAGESTSNNPRAFARVGGDLYWVNDSTSTGTGEVLRLSAGAGAPSVLASAVAIGDGIAVDDSGVFWSGTTSILHVDAAGTVTTAASDLLFVGRMIAAGGALYYIDGSARHDACAGLWRIDGHE